MSVTLYEQQGCRLSAKFQLPVCVRSLLFRYTVFNFQDFSHLYSVFYFKHNFFQINSNNLIFWGIVFIVNNPCSEGRPLLSNGEAESCDTQICPTGYTCSRGDQYAVCCPGKITFHQTVFIQIM